MPLSGKCNWLVLKFPYLYSDLNQSVNSDSAPTSDTLLKFIL